MKLIPQVTIGFTFTVNGSAANSCDCQRVMESESWQFFFVSFKAKKLIKHVLKREGKKTSPGDVEISWAS